MELRKRPLPERKGLVSKTRIGEVELLFEKQTDLRSTVSIDDKSFEILLDEVASRSCPRS